MDAALQDNLLFWFQAINAIGSLATFGGFVFLFLRDKSKDVQLEKLASVASSQQNIVSQMQQEINEIKEQSLLMRDANEIFARQFELQTTVFQYQQKTDEQKSEELKQTQAIEVKKHLSEIRPLFEMGSVTSNSISFSARLRNTKGTAFNPRVVDVVGDFTVQPIPNQLHIHAGQDIHIEGMTSTGVGMREKYGKIDFRFYDGEDNEYKQEIKIKRGLIVSIGNPFLMPKEA